MGSCRDESGSCPSWTWIWHRPGMGIFGANNLIAQYLPLDHSRAHPF